MEWRWAIVGLGVVSLACRSSSPGVDTEAGTEGPSTPPEASSSSSTTGELETDTETTEPPPETAIITHQFPPAVLDPFEETQPCVSWTLDNEQPLYVQAVTLANDGGFHHSNGFVVPEDVFEGPDGVWNCSERGFNTLQASTLGTVLFAQSTQSWVEEQRFNEGAVVKIPAGYKVVAELHLLNLTAHEAEASLRASLELVHPRDVDVVLTPFAIQYTDLQLPPMSESRVTAQCDQFASKVQVGGAPFAFHWILPHYHYLGNYFRLELLGGSRDGEALHEISGFDASPAGLRLDPPVLLGDAQGIRLTCGFDNWTDQTINYGIGINEMCIAFGFADAAVISQAAADNGEVVGNEGGILRFESNCLTLTAAPLPEQGPPSQAELDGDLYLPPVDPDDQGLPPVPECVDASAEVAPGWAPTLSNLRDHVFPACGFSSCHGSGGQAGGLDLDAADLHAELLGHAVSNETAMPLVNPGAPEQSWLFQKMAKCDPVDDAGTPVTHMPSNAPFLLEPSLVAMVREWIAAGALDD
ncbi:MAG: hypothetical protein AAF799_44080 [Myxococcota bacterium]